MSTLKNTLDLAEFPPDRVVEIGPSRQVMLYAQGRGPNRVYWPAPIADPDDAPWFVGPSRRKMYGDWFACVRGTRGRRDRYHNARTVEEAVRLALSDKKGH